MIIQIPFSGFYYSIHDLMMDNELEYYPLDIQDKLFDSINWHAVRLEYAKEYCKQFAHKFGLDITFESLSSPKYYNYQTDRIFAHISESEVQRIFGNTQKIYLEKTCSEMFTSRDGFISFYDADYRTWGALTEWDHNQLYALLTAHIDSQCWNDYEAAIAEDICCNGVISDLIYKNSANTRLFKIADYLRERAERV